MKLTPTHWRPPRLANGLLRRFGPRDEALVGDLWEAFQDGKSRAWLWRQILTLVIVACWSKARSQASAVVVGGVFATVFALMIYTAIQQLYRRSADAPQIAMATSAKLSLDNGGAVSAIVPVDTIDMRTSLDPFVIVFDAHLKPIATSATLNGRIPVPPKGVFEVVSRNTLDHRFTWQPARGVRSAVVLTHYDGPTGRGFVLVGRSLRVAEAKILWMTRIVTMVWAGSLIALLSFFGVVRSRKTAV